MDSIKALAKTTLALFRAAKAEGANTAEALRLVQAFIAAGMITEQKDKTEE